MVSRTVYPLVLLALLPWSTQAWSTAAHRAAKPPTSPSLGLPPSPSPSPTVARLSFCTGPIPTEWSAGLARRTINLPGVNFGVNTLSQDGALAFGYFQSGQGQGVAEVDLGTGRMSVVATMPGSASGISWMSFSDPWLVWAQGDSQYNLGQWSIHLWNRQTRQVIQLATSQLSDGSYLTGQLVFPIVGHGYVAWSQPASRQSLDLRLYMVGSGKSLTLDSGRLSSPVFAGRNLVWAKFLNGTSQPSFRMVDADTLKPVTVPKVIASPQPIVYLAGSANYLLWTQDNSDMEVLRLGTDNVTIYSGTDVKHPFQFPVLADHFVVWFAADTNTVMDLDTGKAFDVPLPGSVYANDKELVVAKISPPKAAGFATTLSVLPLTNEMSISSCSG